MPYLFLILSLLLIPSALAGLSAAPYVPTRKRDVARFLKLAGIRKGQIVYDLGCGDGRLLVAAAKEGARAIGYEMSLLNYLFCIFFRRGIKVKLRDFFKGDFHDADVVYMFLMPKALDKIGKILTPQMKHGSRIISYVWPINGLTAEKVDQEPGRPNMYLYKM